MPMVVTPTTKIQNLLTYGLLNSAMMQQWTLGLPVYFFDVYALIVTNKYLKGQKRTRSKRVWKGAEYTMDAIYCYVTVHNKEVKQDTEERNIIGPFICNNDI